MLALLAAVPASARADRRGPTTDPPAKASLTVMSSAFRNGGAIPPEYTCDGTQQPPPLAWSNVPPGTRSIAIFVDDLDAPQGTFTHWLVSGIPPTTTSLSAGGAAGGALPQGALAAPNSRGLVGYAGPCPPSGRHRYEFHVYALDTGIAPPASVAAFRSEIDGHVLAEGELIGTYTRITPQ